MSVPTFLKVQAAATDSDLTEIAQLMYWLMLRNMASEGIVYADPQSSGGTSLPGAIVASPSYQSDNVSITTQNYVFNWTRDSAVVATELALSGPATGDQAVGRRLTDYVTFAAICQGNSGGDMSYAKYTIEGQPVQGWVHQNDGPALQTLAILKAFGQLDQATQQTARGVVQANLNFILQHYRDPNHNLWEEVKGQSFFTRSVQLRCLTELSTNSLGLTIPAEAGAAATWLRAALDTHWDDAAGYYVSILQAERARPGYDPNVDIVLASIYGAVSCTDPKLLATAAKVRGQWADVPGTAYPVNLNRPPQLGPLMGRYPGDVYDGDNFDPNHPHPDTIGHPWAVCTANFAQLYYTVAAAIHASGTIPADRAAPFFSQIGVGPTTSVPDAVNALRGAGDAMLQAVVYHSDHFALSEQFDATSGFEKSVHDLSWSYAAFLSAVRARAAIQ